MSDGIRITGNWDFDNNKKIDPKDYDAANLAKLKNTELFKKGKVDFSDGIDKSEAEYIMMEFEKEGLVDFDDFDINDADIKSFLKNQGYQATNAQVKEMKSVVNSIANTYMDANQTANVGEQYTSVQDIYLTGGNAGANVAVGPSKIDPKNINGNTQTITAPGVNKTNSPQQGSTLQELINNAYALDEVAKKSGISDTQGVLHNLVDEYLQSNPELASRISELNDGKNIKDLSYDEILNTNLFKEGEETAFKVIAPKFNMPTPKGAAINKDATQQVAQKQYSTQNTSVDIINNGKELGENQYANVTDAIAAQYGLDKNDGSYQHALKTIAFQIANDPENAIAIETYINSLPKDEAAQYLNDNTRVTALLSAKNIEGLHLPDNVLVNSITNTVEGKEYVYTTGSTVYQLSPLSPVDGQATGQIELPATFDGKETAGSVANLEDILKYSQDPRTGKALTTLNDKGEEVSNIKDEAAQGMATAYMMNSIKDNPEIFAAAQEINGSLQMFGAYEIKDEAVLGKMNELLDAAKAEGLSNEDAAAKVRNELINQFGDLDGDGTGKLEDFLEKYGNVNLDNAKSINFYDDKGNIRFKNEDGTPVTYKVSETYIRFGKASEVKQGGNSSSSNDTPSDPFKPTPSTPGTTSSTPGTTSSTPGTTSSTPGTTSSTPGTTSSTPGTTSSTPGTTSSTPGTTSSTPGATSSTPKPSTGGGSTTPKPSTGGGSTTPKPSSGGGSTTPKPSTGGNSSTPSTGGGSTTPKPSTGGSSSTPSSGGGSSTPSSGGGNSSTPPDDKPIFNPSTSVTEPSESKDPVTNPSKPDEGGDSGSDPGEDCPLPPPPSNAANNTPTAVEDTVVKDTVVAEEASGNKNTVTESSTVTKTEEKTENNVADKTTTSTNTTENKAENKVENNPAPPPPPSVSSGGNSGNTITNNNNENKDTHPVENNVSDKTSDVTSESDKVEHRKPQ